MHYSYGTMVRAKVIILKSLFVFHVLRRNRLKKLMILLEKHLHFRQFHESENHRAKLSHKKAR